MTKSSRDLYIELAELVRANVSGPVKQGVIADAQKRLVRRLRNNGVITRSEADDLSV